MNKIIEFFVQRSAFVNLMTVGLIFAGLIAIVNTKREAFPNIDFDIVAITQVYRGAAPTEVEQLITKYLEDEIRSVDGVKSVISSSLESRSAVTITLDPNFKDKRKVVEDLKDATDRAKMKFPSGLDEPIFTELTSSRTPIIEIAMNFEEFSGEQVKQAEEIKSKYFGAKPLSEYSQSERTAVLDKLKVERLNSIAKDDKGEAKENIEKVVAKELNRLFAYLFRAKAIKKDELALRFLSKQLKDRLEMIGDVSAVSQRGYREREIHVEIDPDKLSRYNISADEIANALAARNLNFPGGAINSDGKEYIIRTVKEFNEAKDVLDVRVRSNDLGGSVKIKDIAVVKDDFEIQSIVEKAFGNEAIVLTALKKESGDAIRLTDLVKQQIELFENEAPAELNIATMNDLSFFVARRLSVLGGNVIIGMILVIVLLLLFLGWRISLMVALGIPFAFAITFLVMGYFDVSINLISMFGLIIVSGMLVDDAIVVGENVYRKLEEGMPPLRAAIVGTQEMVLPVVASVSTTMVAFLPLMMMTGIMGKFIWALPLAIIIALLASLVESFLILPSHLHDITKKLPREKLLKHESGIEARIYNFLLKLYRPVLYWAVNNKYKTMGIISFLFFLAIFLVGITGFILFPKGGIETVTLKAEAPKGVTLEEMNRRVEPLENAIKQLGYRELDSYTSRIGIHQEQPNDPFTKRGKNYGQVMLFLTPANSRKRQSQEIISYLTSKLDPVKNLHSLEGRWQDSSKIISAGYDSFFRVLDTKSRTIKNIEISDDFLIGIGEVEKDVFALVNGKNQIAIASIDKTQAGAAKFENKILNEMEYDQLDSPKSMMVLPGSYLGVLSTQMGKLYQIDFKSGKYSKIVESHSAITSMGLIPNSQKFFITTDAGSLQIYSYDEKNITLQKSITKGAKILRQDGQVTLDLKDTTKLARVEGASLTADGSSLLLSGFNGVVHVVDMNTYEITQAYYLGDEAIYYAIADKNNPNLMLVNKKNILELWDLKNHKKLRSANIVDKIQKHVVKDNSVFLFLSYHGVYELQNFAGLNLRTIFKENVSLEKIEFKQMGGGPPVGAPVSLEIRGDEFDQLKALAQIAKEKLSAIEGVYDVRDNWEEGNDEFIVDIDEERASMAGTTVMQIASTIQMAFDGRVATSIKKSYEEIDIRVIFPEKLRENLDTLKKVYIRNQIGNLVPITELATFKPQKGVSVITHTDYRRTIFVQANVDETKSTSMKVNGEVLKQLTPVLSQYPGYAIKRGGEFEDTQESMQNLVSSFGFAMIGIIAILVLLFGNFKQPIIIISVIPLGFIGVAIAFFMHKILVWPDLTFSFLASFGIIGLAGVVVNDSIILVDYINRLLKKGYNRYNAIIKSGTERLRAVILTTITTVMGVFPTAYGIGGEDPFLKPMALAMGWGLLFATGITLLAVPALYAVWENIVEVIQHKKEKSRLPNWLYTSVFWVALIFLFPLVMLYMLFQLYWFNKHHESVMSPDAFENIEEPTL